MGLTRPLIQRGETMSTEPNNTQPSIPPKQLTPTPSGPTSSWLGVLLFVFGLGLWWSSGANHVMSWVAMALGLVGIQLLWAPVVRPTITRLQDDEVRWARLSGWLAVLGTITVTALLMWPMVTGEMPVSQDHANHYLAMRVFVDDLLAHGRVFGWTDKISSGLPFGDVYATMIYIVPAAATLLSGGIIPFEVSYAWGVVLIWLVPALALACWTRRLSGQSTWIAPVATAFFFVADIGGPREGGWSYSMFHGVWPHVFAMGVWMFSMLALLRLVERPNRRRLGVAILAVGVSLWMHPVNLIHYVLGVPLMALALLLANKERTHPSAPTGLSRLVLPKDAKNAAFPEVQGGFWVVVACVIGGLMGLFWFGNIISASSQRVVVEHMAYWKPLFEVGQDLWRGSLFTNTPFWVTSLAVIGLLASIMRRRVLDIFSLLLFAVLVVLSSMDLLSASGMGLSRPHKLFMYRRLLMVAKMLWFAFAGLGLLLVLQILQETARKQLAHHQAHSHPLALWLLLFVFAPFVWMATVASVEALRAPISRPLTAKVAKIDKDLKKLRLFLEEERARVPKGLKRVIHLRGGSGSYSLIPIINAGWGYLPTYPPPCQVFSWINARKHIDTMRWLGGRILVSYIPRRMKGMKEVATFGKFRVYRLSGVSEYPVKVKGGGAAKVLHWSDHKRVIKLSGMTAKSKLYLGFPPYHRWHVRVGKEKRKLKSWGTHGYTFSSLTGLKDGTVTITYGHSWVSLLATLLGLIAAGCGVFLLFGGASLPYVMSDSLVRAITVTLFPGLIILAVGITGAFMVLARQGLADEWLYKEKERKTLSVVALHHKKPKDYEYGPFRYCVRPFSRKPKKKCSEYWMKPHLTSASYRRAANWSRTVIPACMRFGVPGNGWIKFSYKLPPGTKFLKGWWHRSSGGAYGKMYLGKKVVSVSWGRRFRVSVPKGTKEVRFHMRAPRWYKYLCMELVALRKK